MSPRPSAPEYAERHLVQAVADHPGLGELEIDFRVEGRVVIVSGDLSSEQHRATLLDVIAETCPGYEIHDHTGVANPPWEER